MWANDGPVINWKRDHQIGRGAFSKVYLGLNLETGAQIAVKELDMWYFGLNIPRGSKEEGDLGLRLARSCRRRKWPANANVYHTGGCPWRIFANNVSKVGGVQLANRTRVLRDSRQILRGLFYLHDRKNIHRDIKGANILINENGIVKLADFGCAQVFQGDDSLKGNSNSTMLGSIPSMAPEAINHLHDHVGLKADIWSFGCTVIEMATARPPWPEMQDAVALMYKVAQNEESPSPPPSFDRLGIDCFRDCFYRNPNARCPPGYLLEHPFVAVKGDVDTKPAASARD